ncbi:hypothetical protein [uncultured Paraglaciecola sp.]|uniref:hypothetical protein n=1 Tax=uncultured Paraglaciecola sp. TaxID=1765024 RepID=UPI002603C5C4|nr:hypothetical protein [uncultured Paraglaciecola sp.]
MKHTFQPIALAVLISMSGAVVTGAYANATADWQPVASDRLISMPANIIEKRIEQIFSASPMAMRLSDIDGQMLSTTERIQSLQQDLKNADAADLEDIQYEMVQQKSKYLDLLQESHTLRKQALNKKQGVYQDVLEQLRQQHADVDNNVRVKIQRQQQAALTRMESVMSQVDQNLMHAGYQASSPYAEEYAVNISQIEQLKAKIAQHKANAAPMLDGAEVSSEEYIRQLLHNASLHQSLLDQEALMLSYMARLVALDAQALKYQIAYGDKNDTTTSPKVAKASHAVDLFL